MLAIKIRMPWGVELPYFRTVHSTGYLSSQQQTLSSDREWFANVFTGSKVLVPYVLDDNYPPGTSHRRVNFPHSSGVEVRIVITAPQRKPKWKVKRF